MKGNKFLVALMCSLVVLAGCNSLNNTAKGGIIGGAGGAVLGGIIGKVAGNTAVGAAIGTAAAIVFPMDDFTDFLYLIGSVFAPMIAVMIADFFILKRDHNGETVCVKNLIIWFAGFLLYRKMMTIDLPIGSTLVDIAATILICIVVGIAEKAIGSKQ